MRSRNDNNNKKQNIAFVQIKSTSIRQKDVKPKGFVSKPQCENSRKW